MKFLEASRLRLLIQGALLLVGVLLLVLGILHGEVATILQKATYICLECIGIG